MDLYQFNQTLMEAGKKVLGPRRRKKEEWITTDTWKKIEHRKEKKRKILSTRSARLKAQMESYRTLDKAVKRSTRADKKRYIEKIAEEAETAASKQDMGSLFLADWSRENWGDSKNRRRRGGWSERGPEKGLQKGGSRALQPH